MGPSRQGSHRYVIGQESVQTRVPQFEAGFDLIIQFIYELLKYYYHNFQNLTNITIRTPSLGIIKVSITTIDREECMG